MVWMSHKGDLLAVLKLYWLLLEVRGFLWFF